MAKKQPSLLEALRLLGLGQQEEISPKRIKDEPPMPEPVATEPQPGMPLLAMANSNAAPMLTAAAPALHLERKRRDQEALNALGASGSPFEGVDTKFLKERQASGELTPEILAIVEADLRRRATLEQPEEGVLQAELEKRRAGTIAERKAGEAARFESANLGRIAEESADPALAIDAYLRSKKQPPPPQPAPTQPPANGPTPNADLTGVRTPVTQERYNAVDPLGRIQLTPEMDPVAMIQQGVNEPLAPPVEAVKELGGQSHNFEDYELQALAKRAGEYKKPGVLDALAVLANSVNPRQTPQGSMQFAQLVRGEPERRSAEAMLGQLAQSRGRRQAEEARQGGQFAVEGLRQGGATERAKIGAGARLGAAQIGQQGLIQRAGMQGDTAREVAQINAQGRGRETPGQRIQAANFHALGRINAEIGNVRKQAEAARASLDPAVRASLPALDSKLRELDALKRDAIGVLHNAGAFSDEEAAMFALGEGMESPDMDPEFLEALRAYRTNLNKALQR